MKRLNLMFVLAVVGLPLGFTNGGCGEKTVAKTPESTKKFGTANQPMPPEAREAIMKASRGGPPASAAAPAAKP